MRVTYQLGAVLRAAIRLALLSGLAATALWLAKPVRADVTVLLEEPYSYDGALAGTGHTAVYLSRVCAASPTELRRCLPGENGVVLSRYHDVGGRDWIAIALIPYLYAVDRPEDIPLLVDAKTVARLRNQYRLNHLQDIAPDDPTREIPGGNWTQLVGSAYDRTLYAFEIETTEQRDDEFIASYNDRENLPAYKLVNRNCADFVRQAVNFYYPKSAKRGVIADLGVSTPKHIAKTFYHYTSHHPQYVSSAYIIPQVPGSIRRSKPIHGLVDSIFKAKKYAIPLTVFHPELAAGVGLIYLTNGRFNPPRNARIYSPDGTFGVRLTEDERRSYQKGLEEIARTSADSNLHRVKTSWRQFQEHAQLDLTAAGNPMLRSGTNDDAMAVGLTRSNILSSSSHMDLARELLITRLRQELAKGGPPKISDTQLQRDWELLQQLTALSAPQTAATFATAQPARSLHADR
ncbi:MAG TPA: hypothetical protein VK525_15755 [Candidatus Saccharimonadales bacterium]|nr:hypothetical protein [Candidatus Saccharimonadales bacterium]